MSIDDKQYGEMVRRASPDSPVLLNCIKSFLIGGAICCFGQLLLLIYDRIGMNSDEKRIMVSVTLIVLTAVLTGIGIFDKIGKHAGAGTVVPITGFANSVVSPALEFKSEGFITGTGANIFRISGPVILYSTAASFVYGLFYWLYTVLK